MGLMVAIDANNATILLTLIDATCMLKEEEREKLDRLSTIRPSITEIEKKIDLARAELRDALGDLAVPLPIMELGNALSKAFEEKHSK